MPLVMATMFRNMSAMLSPWQNHGMAAMLFNPENLDEQVFFKFEIKLCS